MKNALIISLNFRVAHISHLIASYRQFEELGYNSILYIHPNLIPFLPSEITNITNLNQIESAAIAIFWFPATKNLVEMLRLKWHFKAKIIYVFHEPIESRSTYRNFGLSRSEIVKIYARYLYQLSFVFISNAIILPSHKALKLYDNSIALKINRHRQYIPLLFSDESNGAKISREYFSYIGTIAYDHAYNEYLRFITQAINDTAIPNQIKFMIATRNKVDRSEEINTFIKNGRLKVIDGHPLSDDEINQCYASSFGVWNAYHRSTQSGVLAKASMFGTPAIVTSKNLSEFATDGKNVIACQNNTSYIQLKEALLKLYTSFDYLSQNSKKIFNTVFNYKIHNNTMYNLLSRLTSVNKSGGVKLLISISFIQERRVA